MHDLVNSPIHYASGSVECIDAIEASMTRDEFLGYLKGNLIKYTWRYRDKGGVQDLQKANWYLTKLIEQWEEPADLSPTKQEFHDVRSQIDGLY